MSEQGAQEISGIKDEAGPHGRDTATGRRPDVGPRGRDAATLEADPRRGWKGMLLRVADRIGTANISVYASAVAFYGFLAIPSALTALVALYGLMFDPSHKTFWLPLVVTKRLFPGLF